MMVMGRRWGLLRQMLVALTFRWCRDICMVLRHIGGVLGLRRGILRGRRSPVDVGAKPVGVEATSGGVEANSNGVEANSDGIEAHILMTFL